MRSRLPARRPWRSRSWRRPMDRTREALSVMAREDPELAARLFVQMLPAVAQRVDGALSYDLAIDGLGRWRVADSRVERLADGANGAVDFTIETSPAGAAALAAGASPLKLMLRRKLKLTGKRRRALKLRALANGDDPTIADALAAGAELDADAIYRALPYLVDPSWTAG